ncbi:MAG: hypothetical protein ACRDGM_17975 [bacterium]
MTIVEACEQVRDELLAKALNAARRNKPLMWAYYEDCYLRVESLLRDRTVWSDEGYLGRLLDEHSLAESIYCHTDSFTCAKRHAYTVYAARILRLAGYRSKRASLAWLRRRAGLGRM